MGGSLFREPGKKGATERQNPSFSVQTGVELGDAKGNSPEGQEDKDQEEEGPQDQQNSKGVLR